MNPKLPKRHPAPNAGTSAKRPATPTGVAAARPASRNGDTASIVAVVVRSDGDIQGGGRPAALPSEAAMRRRQGSGNRS